MTGGVFMKRLFYSAGVAVITVLCTVFLGASADYPTRPITIINPMPPGGGHDLVARGFAPVAEKLLGQPIVVTYKPGATGMVGGLAGAQASPDGYTLTVFSTNVTAAMESEIAVGRKPSFTRHDFTPIACFWFQPTLIVTYYDSPWKTLADLISDVKAKPGHYAFCSGGLYGMSHLPAEIFARATGLKFRHVPYQGGGPCLSALVGKHVDLATQYPGPSLGLIKGNKLRALAVQSDKRLKVLPDIPTCKELGIDAEWHGWVGLLVPKKTPMPVVERLREVAKKVAEDSSFIATIEKAGDEVRYMTGDELAKYMERESEQIGKLLTQLLKEPSPK
jgi:tripartite-type tricarboxylate transporter receptor subunit TctC